MNWVFLNGEFMLAEQAKISPMDRGFLFGDGIYEVIPSYQGKFVGFTHHIERMFSGLSDIGIEHDLTLGMLNDLCHQLIHKNDGENLGVYIHVSRGTDTRRYHAYPQDITPTIFAYAFEIPAPPSSNKAVAKTYKVTVAEDKRWKRCNIKSTALLGNVMHYQFGHAAGFDETLLFNEYDELTEASSCNVFIVKDGIVYTPELDTQKLPGVTRRMAIDILSTFSDITVVEQPISRDAVLNADEVWLTSSTKQIGPIVQIDNLVFNEGKPGPVWEKAQALFSQHQFD